jgi:hypothetical protein
VWRSRVVPLSVVGIEAPRGFVRIAPGWWVTGGVVPCRVGCGLSDAHVGRHALPVFLARERESTTCTEHKRLGLGGDLPLRRA